MISICWPVGVATMTGMNVVFPKPGSYVVAVSGGVDSMVLLDILSRRPELKLTVAHLDHGIRDDSGEDFQLVRSVADTLSVPLVGLEANLGAKTSEAKAREVRYEFLRKVQKDTNGDGIITAHHQDDVIETAMLNIMRGTGRKGLTSISSSDVIRPLLSVPKSELIDYAAQRGLAWREDSTNSDQKYLRNYVRHNYVTQLTPQKREELVGIINELGATNIELDSLLLKYMEDQPVKDLIDRQWFNHLPHNVSREVLATWLRTNGIRDFDSKALERLVVAAKTGQNGKTFPVNSGYNMVVSRESLALDMGER